MPLDKALENALKTAVEEEGQPPGVASRLAAWLEALAVGDVDGQKRFYENVRQALVTEDGADAD